MDNDTDPPDTTTFEVMTVRHLTTYRTQGWPVMPLAPQGSQPGRGPVRRIAAALRRPAIAWPRRRS
jgi:hypothetical protein